MKKAVLNFLIFSIIFGCNTDKPNSDFSDQYFKHHKEIIKQLKSDGFKFEQNKKLNKIANKNPGIFFKSNVFKINANNQLHLSYFAFANTELKNENQKVTLSNIGDLEKVTVGKNIKHIKNPPLFIIFNDYEIIKLSYSCNAESETSEKIIESLRKYFRKDKSKILNLKCGGPLIWE